MKRTVLLTFVTLLVGLTLGALGTPEVRTDIDGNRCINTRYIRACNFDLFNDAVNELHDSEVHRLERELAEARDDARNAATRRR